MSSAYNELLNQITLWFDEQFSTLKNESGLGDRQRALSAELAKLDKLLNEISRYGAEKPSELVAQKAQIEGLLAAGEQELVEIEKAIENLEGIAVNYRRRLQEFKPGRRSVSRGASRGPIRGSWTLRVTMPDGEVIQEPKASETFVMVLAKLGLDRLAENQNYIQKGYPLVSRKRNPRGHSLYEFDGYYIETHSGSEYKSQLLKRIADDLGYQIKIEVF